MKRGLVALLVAGATVLAACGDSGGGAEIVGSTVRLKSGASLDGAQVCGTNQPQCPSGLSCVTIPLEGAVAPQTLCVNDKTICEQLECTEGKCALLESFPARVTCVSTSGPDPYYP